MPTVAELINDVIAKRQELLPKFMEQSRQLTSLEAYLDGLNHALDEFLRNEKDNEQVKVAAASFKKTFSKDNLDQFKDIMKEVVERASRKTVTIGVSGVARVGKSTLLQAISGLEDDQIPTGSTVPVTAVRSTIHYSNEKSCAELDMYSWEEFRKEVLEVYANELNIQSVPKSPDDVSAWSLPDIPDDLLNRLKYIKGSFHSYREYLTGNTVVKNLEDIRPFLTYSEDNNPQASRPYLAVKRARVYCRFPHAEVENLTLMDLPGLGEISLDIEEFHAQDLRRDVDIVLLIKRAEQGMGFWKDSDRATLDILKKAKGHVESIYDYMFIVNNAGKLPKKAVSDMMNHIEHNYSGFSNTTFLEWNSIESASREVLVPTLKHLAERLPVMDEQVFRGAIESTTKIRRQLQYQLTTLHEVLKDAIPTSQNENEAITAKTDQIRASIALDMGNYQEELEARDSKKEYIQTLDQIIKSLKNTIQNGFGIGEEKWLENCRASDITHKGTGIFIHTEINNIRTMIASAFSELDMNLANHLDSMISRIARILKSHLGDMMPEEPSVYALKRLMKKLTFSKVGCDHTIKTIQELLDAQITYRAHLSQFVRPTLDNFVWGKQSDLIVRIFKDSKKKGSEHKKILNELQKSSNAMVDLAEKELIKQSDLAAKVIRTLFVSFEDQLIRAKLSRIEFQRIVHHFRLEIDEDYFSNIKRANYRVDQIHKSIQKLHKAIDFSFTER